MSYNNKISFLLLIFILTNSCDSKKISFFQGQYFKVNQELELNLNDGDYVYKKKFNENYSVGNLELIKNYNVYP
ncbi:hypothetical protein AEQU1_03164 [Aequorivita sp. CIP111184]|nr:hypothetical protein AEQU1_03164 [Aequorivita sp. CIP111184]